MSDSPPDAVRGHFFDGRSSQPVAAYLRRSAGGDVIVHAESDAGMLARATRHEYHLSERLGDTPRYVDLPDGLRFETLDNTAIERLFETGGGLVHWLESRYRYVLVAVLVLLASGTWTAMIGIPMFADWAAHQLPGNTYQQVGRYTLEYLDEYLFEPTELPATRRDQLQQRFAPYLDEYRAQGIELRVHFRAMGSANAMALPSGDLIFTDEIIELAEHDDELVAVLAHEIGHVARRHAVRRSLQATILAAALTMFVGDAAGMSELLTGVPLVLMELGYSRNMEREADDFALQVMIKHGIRLSRFSDLMSRLDEQPDCDKNDPRCQENAWTRYLSTHPATGERLQRFTDSRVNLAD